jgi:hypothetical protein
MYNLSGMRKDDGSHSYNYVGVHIAIGEITGCMYNEILSELAAP